MQSVTEAPAPEGAEVGGKLRVSAQQRAALEEWFEQELSDAKSGRREWERWQMESLRLYEGRPKLRKRNYPIKNAPNPVVALSGTATDKIYSAVSELIWSISPVLSARPTQMEFERHARALQRWIDYSVGARWRLKAASDSALHDTCRGGTGFYFIPFQVDYVKTKVEQVKRSSPRVYAWPPEDIFEPAGSWGELQDLEWISVRHWLTETQLQARGLHERWKVERAEAAPRRGDMVSKVREAVAHTRTQGLRQCEQYEIHEVWALYDIDGDGQAEDLYFVYDATSRRILRVRFNPYDSKPLSVMNFQKRSHMVRGLGVPELLSTFQDASTEVLCYWLANMLLANSRVWKGPAGSKREFQELYPGKYVTESSPGSVEAVPMADVYGSGPAAMQIILSLAEQRIGINELGTKSSHPLGNRTPGITALTYVQQQNQRFSAAFDSMRLGTAEAARQCLLREQEQLLAGNSDLQADLERVLGLEDAAMVITLLRDQNFDEHVSVEVTAGSVSLNREADKQSAMLLLQSILPYYERSLALIQMWEQLPEGSPTKEAAREVLEKANLFISKVLSTFDQIRNPEFYLIQPPPEAQEGNDINQQLQAILGGGSPGAAPAGDPLAALLGGLQGGVPGGAGGGAAGVPMEAAPGLP